MQVTNENYGADLKSKEAKKLQKTLEQKSDRIITQEYGNYAIQKKTLETQRQDALANLHESGQTAEEVNAEFDTLVQQTTDAFKERVSELLQDTVPELCEEVVKTVETQKREQKKETIEEAVHEYFWDSVIGGDDYSSDDEQRRVLRALENGPDPDDEVVTNCLEYLKNEYEINVDKDADEILNLVCEQLEKLAQQKKQPSQN